MKKVKFLMLLVLVLGAIAAYSQKDPKELLKADEAYLYGEYDAAIEDYKLAYAKIEDKVKKAEIIFKTAMCYKYLSKSKEAELWFKKAISVKYPNPITVLYYADAMKMNGKYDEAVIEYQKYKKLVPNDPRGDNGVKSCELTAKWINEPTRYKVNNKAFFNSPQSDYSPSFAKKDNSILYFSSGREGSSGNKKHKVTGEAPEDIYYTQMDRKGSWSTPQPLEGLEVNTEASEGTPSLNEKCNSLYFTRCAEVKGAVMGCKVITATKKGVNWGDCQEVVLANDSVTVKHPSVSMDDLTLYFVADMPGGQGGYDIWMVKRDKKTQPWSSPINLGSAINTSGNEIFPYAHPDGSLYFASDYHIGMGGFDIFKAEKDKKGKWVIKNLKYPINSSFDDFGIVFDNPYERGFFTSNRPGGKGKDDIYEFSLPPLEFILKGKVRDEKTDEVIVGAGVKLIGSDGSMVERKTEIDGSFLFNLKPNTDYVVETSHEKYLNGKSKESTKGIEEDKTFDRDIYMAPIEKPIELPNIMYDLGSWDLRPESMVSLDKLVETLNDNPNIVIELRSHTDFRGVDQDNLVLSQKRAQSVVDFLIEKGIDPARLVAKGYGESMPKTVDKKIGLQYTFLKEGDLLNEAFIRKLASVEQEFAHQLNRRTEFQVISTTFVPAETPETEDDTIPE